jgi:hypothetical protein
MSGVPDVNEDWPSRSYSIGSVLNWLMFLAVVFVLTRGEATGHLPYAARAALVLLLAISVAVQFVVAYRSVAARDEFVRGLAFKRGIAAAGITITAAVLWGLAEQFLGAPHVPMWLVYPLFWGTIGIVTPIIRSSHA